MNDVRQSNHFTIPIFQSAVVNPLLKMTDTMYAMKPVFDLDAEVEVPGCMYSLPVIQSSNRIPGVGASATTSTFVPAGVVKALEVRQDAIQARLEKLKTEVAAYKKCLGLQEDAGQASQVISASHSSFPAIFETDSTSQIFSKLWTTVGIIEASSEQSCRGIFPGVENCCISHFPFLFPFPYQALDYCEVL